MGISHYDKPGAVHGWIKDNETGELEMLNSPRVQVAVQLKGEEFIETAKGVFEAQSRHDSRPPEFYVERFSIQHALHEAVRAIEVWNHDPTAEWVEFGAHAGGEERILRYRVFGRTSDIMEARAEE
jgi:hypothetical protein